VPQILWIPSTVADRRHHIQDAELQMPIFFLHTDGRLGLPLDAAVVGRCDTLLNAQCSAPLGPQTTTHVRIGVCIIFSAVVYFLLTDSVGTFQWVGYCRFKRQVQIRDERPQRNTVTLSKFAQHVGRSVEAFIRVRSPLPCPKTGALNPPFFIPTEPPTGYREPCPEMADRGKGYPAQRNRNRRCHPGFIWQLDADLATHPLYFLTSAQFHVLFLLNYWTQC